MRSLRSLGLLGLYVGAQLVALVLALPFKAAGLASTSNPNNPTDPLYIIALIVIVPIPIIWFAARKGGPATLRALILLGISASLFITLQAAFALVTPPPFYLGNPAAGAIGDWSVPLAGIVAVTLLLALTIEPQWYVVDLAGFVAAGSLIALLGISFGILPTFILLLALMVYDAVAVYGTKHMLTLADVVTEMKVPILMVMPSESGFDYTRSGGLKSQQAKPREEREAMFMGLGDVVIPGTLVVSAFISLPARAFALGIGGNLIAAFGALAGSLVGYLFLIRLVNRGNAQAGLPFLNGGAIAGYAVAYLAVFHNPSLGIQLAF
ncbi:MAG TPA: presenilin family intramembrane aspartyl protease PSH [Thermoplasmata archaeon]|jgi:presenilin-like A22 family membrane protease|nr:presenilin family intramembrane aspartyl protease PSH [Thermoplasmata archaeon]